MWAQSLAPVVLHLCQIPCVGAGGQIHFNTSLTESESLTCSHQRTWSYQRIQRNNIWLRLICSLLDGEFLFILSSHTSSVSAQMGFFLFFYTYLITQIKVICKKSQSQFCLLSGRVLWRTNIQTLPQSLVTTPPAWTACGSLSGSAGRRTWCRRLKATPGVWPEGSFTSPASSASSSWPERWLVRWKSVVTTDFACCQCIRKHSALKNKKKNQ